MKKQHVVDGPFGLRLPDDHALFLDRLVRTLPKDFTYKRAALKVSDLQLQPGERCDVSLVSTENCDADGELILAKGVDLNLFRQAPNVLMNHDWDQDPVGLCKWIKAVQGGLLAKTYYFKRPKEAVGEWRPDTVYGILQQGGYASKSVGLMPTQMRPPNAEESSRYGARLKNVITHGHLFEYSVVTVGATPEAKVLAVAKKKKTNLLDRVRLDAHLAAALAVKKLRG